jgi:hypothetical protein
MQPLAARLQFRYHPAHVVRAPAVPFVSPRLPLGEERRSQYSASQDAGVPPPLPGGEDGGEGHSSYPHARAGAGMTTAAP